VNGQLGVGDKMVGIEVADVTVCTATIPTRVELLERAIRSVTNQTLKVQEHSIKLDLDKLGQPAVLDQIIQEAKTKYVAILDDDDELLPNHIELLYKKIIETDADLVFPHFRYSNLSDAGHLEMFRGLPWDNNNPHQVPVTWIAKRQSILDVGGFSGDFDVLSYEVDNQGNRIGNDFNLVKKLAKANKHITNISEITWIYHVGHPSTLGMPIRW
jgi:glycosyltransferase involved in cell wall biosynthesis